MFFHNWCVWKTESLGINLILSASETRVLLQLHSAEDFHTRLQTSLLWPSICPSWLDMRSNPPSLPPNRFHHSFEFLRSVISNCGFSLFFSPLSLYGSGSQKGKWHHVGGKLKTYPQGPAGEPGTSGRRRIPTEEINSTQSMNGCFLNQPWILNLHSQLLLRRLTYFGIQTDPPPRTYAWTRSVAWWNGLLCMQTHSKWHRASMEHSSHSYGLPLKEGSGPGQSTPIGSSGSAGKRLALLFWSLVWIWNQLWD